jgi:hypothetical protein
MHGQLARLSAFNYTQNYSQINGQFFTLGILKKSIVFLLLSTETGFKGTDPI